MMDPRTTVVAVIPSVNRPQLKRAIQSVRAQETSVTIRICVIFDLPTDPSWTPSCFGVDEVLFTGGGKGASAARNLGVNWASDADYVAFLDDDDEWTPDKVDLQLAAARSSRAQHVAVAGRHLQVTRGATSQPIPTVCFDDSEFPDVATYLFRRRRPGGGRASMYTSTLLISGAAARAHRWDDSLSRHQDWDLLVRLGADPNLQVLQVPSVVARIYSGSAGSISASKDWQTSLAWAEQRLLPLSPQVFSDFITAQTLRYAINGHSASGLLAWARSIWNARRMPALGPILIGAGGLLPRKALESIMMRVR